jgi:UDPglucose--hexose-1-phosphate uridylyltransferase
MAELRQNIVTREWVIIASERAKRPNLFAQTDRRVLTEEHPVHDARCPFCPGNEERDLEVLCMPDREAWQVRVVRNKFPALSEEGSLTQRFDGRQPRMAGIGYHEVVIEHRIHNKTLALMTSEEIQQVLEIFQQRGRAMAKDPRIQHITYFKNHGERAGASLLHPHSQIIALPVVPSNVQRRIEETQHYYDAYRQCPVCTMLEEEMTRGERVVVEGQYFAAFLLYAALSPFHMWIVPFEHRRCFFSTERHELADLAEVVRSVLHRLYRGLNDPDFNMIVRTVPVKDTVHRHFHWYISLVPRVSRMAGFELGSGMHINALPPEEAAAFLRNNPDGRGLG